MKKASIMVHVPAVLVALLAASSCGTSGSELKFNMLASQMTCQSDAPAIADPGPPSVAASPGWQMHVVPGEQSRIGWRHAVADLKGDGTLAMVEAAGGDNMAQPLFVWAESKAHSATEPGVLHFGHDAAAKAGLYYTTAVTTAPISAVRGREIGNGAEESIFFGTMKGACAVGGNNYYSTGIWKTRYDGASMVGTDIVFPHFSVRDFILADVDQDGLLDLIVAGIQGWDPRKGWPGLVGATCQEHTLDETKNVLAGSKMKFNGKGTVSADSLSLIRLDEFVESTDNANRSVDKTFSDVATQCRGKRRVDGLPQFQVSVHLNCKSASLPKSSHCRAPKVKPNISPRISPAELEVVKNRELYFDPAAAWTLNAPYEFTEPTFVRARDVNADGVLDLVVAVSSTAIFLLNGELNSKQSNSVAFGGKSGRVGLQDLESSIEDCGAQSQGAAAGCKLSIGPRMVTAMDLYHDQSGTHLAATTACFDKHTSDACCNGKPGELVMWNSGSALVRREIIEKEGFEADLLPTALAWWSPKLKGQASSPTLLMGTLRPVRAGFLGPMLSISESGRGRVDVVNYVDGSRMAPVLGWFLEFGRADYGSTSSHSTYTGSGPLITLPGPPSASVAGFVEHVMKGDAEIHSCVGKTSDDDCYRFSARDGTVTLYGPDRKNPRVTVTFRDSGRPALTFSEAFFPMHSGWIEPAN